MIDEKNEVTEFLQDLQDGAQRPQEAAERLPEPFENLQVPGTVLVRDRVQRASEGIHLENPDLRDLLTALPGEGLAEPIMDFRAANVAVLDIDNHEGRMPREAVRGYWQSGAARPVEALIRVLSHAVPSENSCF